MLENPKLFGFSVLGASHVCLCMYELTTSLCLTLVCLSLVSPFYRVPSGEPKMDKEKDFFFLYITKWLHPWWGGQWQESDRNHIKVGWRGSRDEKNRDSKMNKSQEGHENIEKRRWWLLGKLEWRVICFLMDQIGLNADGKRKDCWGLGGGC